MKAILLPNLQIVRFKGPKSLLKFIFGAKKSVLALYSRKKSILIIVFRLKMM